MSRSGLTGGSEGDDLMRGSLVTPSGVVPPPLKKDVISSPIMSMPVSLASGSVSSVGGVGALGPPNPSLGQFGDPIRQAFDQSRARDAPGFGNFHDSLRNLTFPEYLISITSSLLNIQPYTHTEKTKEKPQQPFLLSTVVKLNFPPPPHRYPPRIYRSTLS